MKFFDFIFYKLYRVGLRSSISEIAVFVAFAFSSLLLFINILSINGFLHKKGILPFFMFEEKYSAYVTITLFIVIFLFIYIPKGKYKKVIKKYDDIRDWEGTWKGRILLILYILATAVAFVYVASFVK